MKSDTSQTTDPPPAPAPDAAPQPCHCCGCRCCGRPTPRRGERITEEDVKDLIYKGIRYMHQ